MRSLEAKLETFLDKQGKHFSHGPQSFVSDCMACGKESHMYIRKEDGQTICFKCGTTWNWRGLVATISGCNVEDAWNVLFGPGAGDQLHKLNIHLGNIETDITEKKDKPMALPLDFFPVQNSEAGMEYLRSRGVCENLIDDYEIRFHTPMNAVVFPVFMDGSTYGWQARRIAPKEGEIRLISAKGFKKANFLLNYDIAKEKKDIILTEGPFDCLHTDVDDYGAVCSFGKLVSFKQIKLILDSKAENVYLGLDSDAARQVYQILKKIGEDKRVFRMRPPEHREDFGEATPDEVREAIRTAHPIQSHVDLLEVHFK